jgi:hypothetical protein
MQFPRCPGLREEQEGSRGRRGIRTPRTGAESSKAAAAVGGSAIRSPWSRFGFVLDLLLVGERTAQGLLIFPDLNQRLKKKCLPGNTRFFEVKSIERKMGNETGGPTSSSENKIGTNHAV